MLALGSVGGESSHAAQRRHVRISSVSEGSNEEDELVDPFVPVDLEGTDIT